MPAAKSNKAGTGCRAARPRLSNLRRRAPRLPADRGAPGGTAARRMHDVLGVPMTTTCEAASPPATTAGQIGQAVDLLALGLLRPGPVLHLPTPCAAPVAFVGLLK
jgi:hypothetical protein